MPFRDDSVDAREYWAGVYRAAVRIADQIESRWNEEDPEGDDALRPELTQDGILEIENVTEDHIYNLDHQRQIIRWTENLQAHTYEDPFPLWADGDAPEKFGPLEQIAFWSYFEDLKYAVEIVLQGDDLDDEDREHSKRFGAKPNPEVLYSTRREMTPEQWDASLKAERATTTAQNARRKLETGNFNNPGFERQQRLTRKHEARADRLWEDVRRLEARAGQQ